MIYCPPKDAPTIKSPACLPDPWWLHYLPEEDRDEILSSHREFVARYTANPFTKGNPFGIIG